MSSGDGDSPFDDLHRSGDRQRSARRQKEAYRHVEPNTSLVTPLHSTTARRVSPQEKTPSVTDRSISRGNDRPRDVRFVEAGLPLDPSRHSNLGNVTVVSPVSSISSSGSSSTPTSERTGTSTSGSYEEITELIFEQGDVLPGFTDADSDQDATNSRSDSESDNRLDDTGEDGEACYSENDALLGHATGPSHVRVVKEHMEFGNHLTRGREHYEKHEETSGPNIDSSALYKFSGDVIETSEFDEDESERPGTFIPGQYTADDLREELIITSGGNHPDKKLLNLSHHFDSRSIKKEDEFKLDNISLPSWQQHALDEISKAADGSYEDSGPFSSDSGSRKTGSSRLAGRRTSRKGDRGNNASEDLQLEADARRSNVAETNRVSESERIRELTEKHKISPISCLPASSPPILPSNLMGKLDDAVAKSLPAIDFRPTIPPPRGTPAKPAKPLYEAKTIDDMPLVVVHSPGDLQKDASSHAEQSLAKGNDETCDTAEPTNSRQEFSLPGGIAGSSGPDMEEDYINKHELQSNTAPESDLQQSDIRWLPIVFDDGSENPLGSPEPRLHATVACDLAQKVLMSGDIQQNRTHSQADGFAILTVSDEAADTSTLRSIPSDQQMDLTKTTSSRQRTSISGKGVSSVTNNSFGTDELHGSLASDSRMEAYDQTFQHTNFDDEYVRLVGKDKRKSEKYFIPGFIIIVVALAISLGVFFGSQNADDIRPTSIPTLSPSGTQTMIPSTQPSFGPASSCNYADTVQVDGTIYHGVFRFVEPSMADLNGIELFPSNHYQYLVEQFFDLWYRFQGTDLFTTLRFCPQNASLLPYILRGDCQGTLTDIRFSQDVSQTKVGQCYDLMFRSQSHFEYKILFRSTTQDTSFLFQLADNRDCNFASPLDITGATTQKSYNTDGTNNDLPICSDGPLPGRGTWYRIKGRGNGVSISTCESIYVQSQIFVYQGDCDNLQCIEGDSRSCPNGLNSLVTFTSNENDTNLIYVATEFQALMGTMIISAEGTGGGGSSECGQATVLSIGETIQSFVEGGSLGSDSPPVCTSSDSGKAVAVRSSGSWFRFQGTGAQVILNVACQNPTSPLRVSIYRARNVPDHGCSNYRCIAATKKACKRPVSWFAKLGKSYYLFFHVAGNQTSVSFDFSVQLATARGLIHAAGSERAENYVAWSNRSVWMRRN